MTVLIEAVFKIIGYSLFFYGLWLLIGQAFIKGYIESIYRQWKRQRKIKKIEEINKKETNENSNSKVIEHLDTLINSVASEKRDLAVINFLILSFILVTLSTSIFYILINDLVLSIFVGLILGLLPYLSLRFRLINNRLKSSYAFFKEFHIIVQNYQTSGKSIYYTLLNATKEIENKQLRKIFIKLLASLQDRSEESFKKQITIFMYSIDSTFAKRFAKLIGLAHLENIDINKALLDLNEDIKKRQKDMEKDTTNKVESVITGYFPIVLFPLMFYSAYRVAGALNFWHYFKQPVVIGVFTIALICSILSVSLAYIFNKPRTDI